jgi:hypothetical protein
MAEKKVQWGMVLVLIKLDWAFSAREVTTPVKGELYNGHSL